MAIATQDLARGRGHGPVSPAQHSEPEAEGQAVALSLPDQWREERWSWAPGRGCRRDWNSRGSGRKQPLRQMPKVGQIPAPCPQSERLPLRWLQTEGSRSEAGPGCPHRC